MTSKGGPIVVVGDALLDRAGGAGLAAVLAAGMTRRRVVLVAGIGDDQHAGRLLDRLRQHVDVHCLTLVSGAPPVPGWTGRALRCASAILVSDYGLGTMSHPAIRAMLAELSRDVPIVWDPHPVGERLMPRVRLVSANAVDARLFARGADGGAGQSLSPAVRQRVPLREAADDAGTLARAWGAPVAVTLGPVGALLSIGYGPPFIVSPPVLAKTGPTDLCGAGDCFAAAATIARRRRVSSNGGRRTGRSPAGRRESSRSIPERP